jgi:hypothetical protein
MSRCQKCGLPLSQEGTFCSSCGTAQVSNPAAAQVHVADLLSSKFIDGLIIGFCFASIIAASLVLLSLNDYYWHQYNVLISTGVMLNEARFQLLDLVAIMALCPGLIVMASYLMVFGALCHSNQTYRHLLLDKKTMSLGNGLVFVGALEISLTLIDLIYDYYHPSSSYPYSTAILFSSGLLIITGITLLAVIYSKETRQATKFKAQTVIQ